MKKNCCAECEQEIDPMDFYMECRVGNICSECLVGDGPEIVDRDELFRPRGVRLSLGPQSRQLTDEGGRLLTLPMKEAY